jgi:anti-sigma regulatory factor (Ser/Thr protein kinase)
VSGYLTTASIPPMPNFQIELEPVPASARRARELVARCAEAFERTPHAELAQLIVTELVANSVRHAGPPIFVGCEPTEEGLKITVRDGSFGHPVMQQAQPTDERGRGVRLIDALSDRWGVDDHPDGTKSVWVEVRARSGSDT